MLQGSPTISLWDMRCYMPFPANSQPPPEQRETLSPAQLYQSLSNLVVRFVASLTTNGTGCLAQIWAPSVADDGGLILSTQVITRSRPTFTPAARSSLCGRCKANCFASSHQEQIV